MTPATPAWQPYDPSSEGLPDSLQALVASGEEDGRVIAVAVAPTSDGTWAAEVSVRIAEACAGRDSRVLLVDLDLESPSLERVLGETPGEGIADVFQFGASIHRVTRAVREGAFLFASAGTVTGDPSSILVHPGWEQLLGGYSASGATVILHVSLLTDGAEAVLSRAGRIVLLSGPGDLPESLLPDDPGGSVAWVGPPVETGREAEAGEYAFGGGDGVDETLTRDPLSLDPLAADDEEGVASLEVLLSESGETDIETHSAEQGPRDATPGRPSSPAFDETAPAPPVEDVDPFWDDESSATSTGDEGGAAAEDPLAPGATPTYVPIQLPEEDDTRPAKKGSRRRTVIFGILLLAVAVVVALALLSRGDAPAANGAVGVADVEPPVAVEASRTAEPPPAVPADQEGAGEAPADPDARPSEDHAPAETTSERREPAAPGADAPAMAFGLTINAHERRSAAEEQAGLLAANFTDLQFLLVPIEVGGTVYYRVVAGPAASRAEAEAVRRRLAGLLGSGVAGSAIVRSTRWAFLLGEFSDYEDAVGRLALATRAEVPAYLAEYPTASGDLFYRVYAGAYANEGESAYLRRVLDDAGLARATLTKRMGRPPR